MHESRYQVTLARTTAEQLPSLYLEPIVKPRRIFTIETWLSCFHIFIAIYTRRHPHEAPALMKYCGVIQDLAESGFNWCFYDENFCLLRQAQPSSFRWCNIHWELWMRTQHSTASKPQTLPGCLRSHEQGIPKGFCFKFHRVSSVPLVVLLSIYVTNSKALKKPVNVIFVPKAKTLGNNPSCQVPTLKALANTLGKQTWQHP